jgi:excinuclease UvrABC nuclease subunit
VAFVSSGEGSDSKKLSVFQHAVKVYNEPLNQRSLIRKDNNGLVGVYAWVNRVNLKIYVGSGDPLYVRLSDYFQSWYF